MKRRIAVAGALLAGVLLQSAMAEDFDYCLVCHGANGNGNVAIKAPRIAGLESWYVARQLEAFATGMRGRHVDDHAGLEMAPIGSRLQQEQAIDAAVRFVSSLQPRRPAATIHGDTQKGRQYFVSCAACHGTKGEGNSTLQAPALANRSDWYLLKQLDDFRNGRRGAVAGDSAGAQMRAAVSMLSDEQATRDVVAYINTLE